MNLDAAKILRTKSTRFRGPVARGAGRVDREGGRNQAGLIHAAAVITRGEAFGHCLWIDHHFLRQARDAINAAAQGIKARFTHPDMSSDGLGTLLGRFRDAHISADVVRGDLHLARAAHNSPDGDLAAYIMDLAEEDPSAFGESISFYRDARAERAFMLDNGATEDDDGHLDPGGFTSPDERNTENLPHARLAQLLAVDTVDDPAANPAGLFHRGQELAQEADALAAYALGLTREPPELVTLSVDADRVAGFVHRFLTSHGLTIQKDPEPMTKAKSKASPVDLVALDQATATDATTADAVDVEHAEDLAHEDAAADPAAQGAPPLPSNEASADARGECRRFLEAFGSDGAVWFAEGLSFEAAKDKRIDQLTAQLADANRRLAAVDRGETSPADFNPESTAEDRVAKKAAANLGEKLAPLAAQNAASMAARK